jgi:hypothetical protein
MSISKEIKKLSQKKIPIPLEDCDMSPLLEMMGTASESQKVMLDALTAVDEGRVKMLQFLESNESKRRFPL